MAPRPTRTIEICLALTVGVVLADSSIVTLALPSILREFDATVFGVSWVLTAFNLVLALLILPAVRIARTPPAIGLDGRPRRLRRRVDRLRCVRNGPGADRRPASSRPPAGRLVVACAIESLARLRGSHELAAPIWGAAATIGIAVGPALGGVLTQVLDWQSIFYLQVPLLLLIPVATTPAPGAAGAGPTGPLDLRPEVGLALLSAGLTGALFLLVSCSPRAGACPRSRRPRRFRRSRSPRSALAGSRARAGPPGIGGAGRWNRHRRRPGGARRPSRAPPGR